MKRNIKIDFLKVFGIISVVLGHCIPTDCVLSRIIYLINIPVFFIVSGYLYSYKDEKNNNIWTFLGKKIGRFWKYYFIYCLIFVIFRNLFVKVGILGKGCNAYGLQEFLFGFANGALFISNEPFSAAMWFIPVLIIGLTVFNSIIYYSSKFDGKKKYAVQLLLVLFTTFVGYIYNKNNMNIGLHYQTSLFIQVFMLIGYYYKLNEEKISKSKNIDIIRAIIIVLTIFIIGTVINFTKVKIDLSANFIPHPIIFIVCASLFTVSLYYIADYILIINKKTLDNKIVSYISRNTISIMCLHILVFKTVDLIICHIINNTDKLSLFPYSFSGLPIVYTVSGVIIPLLIHYVYELMVGLILKRKQIYLLLGGNYEELNT